MKPLRAAAALIVLAAACTPITSSAEQQNARRGSADAKNCVPPATHVSTATNNATTKPPLVSVCVSDPDTQLNLPWFLTDIINAVNTHQSAGDPLHKMKKDF